MPLGLPPPAQISSSQIGGQRLLMIWEIEAGVGGKVLTGKEKCCPSVRDRKQLGCEGQLSVFHR